MASLGYTELTVKKFNSRYDIFLKDERRIMSYALIFVKATMCSAEQAVKYCICMDIGAKCLIAI